MLYLQCEASALSLTLEITINIFLAWESICFKSHTVVDAL